ncbi:beta-galactosidase [Pedobacter steynii]|uniref:Beta-galactosidase n=1 Tax=Pedobacter steynii TaxID=430522 RepID=A0A1H0G309_9SPHI|nr:glycoside hydrolase family 2 TIM barrel-domain containing protein [Pedobacter steynii]NQX42307.1 DUF4982 domain-containing protein [Pedobacter steynii]SDO01277.1 beta-galactosidase [Pedobacter steynii]
MSRVFQKCIVLAIIILTQIGEANSKSKKPRVDYNLSTGWAFYRGDAKQAQMLNYDDSKWMPVVLPHIMQLEKKHNGADIIYDGVGWYRRYFKLSKDQADKQVLLNFEGIMSNSEVFVNGESVGIHHGGYVGFTMDVSDKVKFNNENNVIAVRVSAEYDPLTPPGKPQDRLDFYYYSGIYRDANLTVTDKLHITSELSEHSTRASGVFVTYPQVNEKRSLVHVKTEVANSYATAKEGYLQTLLKDANGKVVASNKSKFHLGANKHTLIEQDLNLINPKLWYPYTPYLYSLESQVLFEDGKVVDIRTEKIGVRTIKFTRDEGFFINGKHLYLVGANRHEAFPNVGDAASNSMQERDVIEMKKGGYNAVRAAHYPQDPAFLAACDKYGLLVVECVPGWQIFNENPVFADRLESITRNMIRRDRNRASIILWETALNETSYPLQVVKRIFDAAHEEYPGDQLYTAGDYFSHEETEPYYDVFYKQVSKFPKDGSVMSNYLEDQIAIKPLFSREWGDGVGEKPRVSMVENEYEQMRQGRSRLRQLNGDGYFDWCMLDANPRMGGHFMWSYNDYTRGAEEETMYSGVVDVNRYPKFAYYMMQSMRPSGISQKGLYEGPVVFVASFNSSGKYKTSTSEITVYSNCDAVELYRNNKLIGKQTRAERAKVYPHIVAKGGSPSFVFDAGGFEPGELKAIGYINGKKVTEHAVRTAGKADHIEIVVPDHHITPVADGSDMIPVYFKICDANGSVVHDAKSEIFIRVKGEGTLIGDGISRVEINPQAVEAGIGFAFIRTSKKAGKIEIQVESKGMKAGLLTINTVAYKGMHLPDGTHGEFKGREEDGAIVKPTKWDKGFLTKPKVEISNVSTTSSHPDFPTTNLLDGNDYSWWIANQDQVPQVVTLTLKESTTVVGSRVRFQKDSSKYRHKVEVSSDGKTWEPVYEKECTGWDFKPVRFKKTIKYFRVSILSASEGRAGLAEVTLFKDK